jgi:CelD/BcsL family acetyltransferase involved in cellulose biosynthesis
LKRPYLHSSAGIAVRCFESLEAAAELRGAVNALNKAADRPDPFSTFEFYENYCRHDEDPADERAGVWFLVAFQGGHLVGYLALRLTVRRLMGLPLQTLGFLVKRDTDRPHLVARAEHIEAVTAAMFQYLQSRDAQWTLLEFHQQDPATERWSALAAAAPGYVLKHWPSLEHCSISVRWETLRQFVGSMARKFRANLGRQMRHLLASGEVQLLRSSDPATAPEMLSLYLAVESNSWKARAHTGISRSPRRMDYFRGLADGTQSMRLWTQILLFDGIPIAGMIYGEFRQKLYVLQMVYDERYGRLAPGSALLLMAVRHAIDGKFQCLNLLSGFGYFKARWLAECTQTHVVQIYRKDGAPYWIRLLGDWKRWIFSRPSRYLPGSFNPARREVSDKAASQVESAAPLASASEEEKSRGNELVARVRAGQCEFLTTPELAAVMPFER